MKLVFFILLLMSTPIFAKDYILKEKAFTIGTCLDIEGYGQITQEVLTLTRSFEVTGKLPCKSSEEFLSLSTTYNIYIDDKLQYIVSKEILESFFTINTKYTIYDAGHKRLASSQLFRGLRPTIVIDEGGGIVTTLKASGLNYYTWKIHQPDNSKIDPRVFWVIAASKTAADNKD